MVTLSRMQSTASNGYTPAAASAVVGEPTALEDDSLPLVASPTAPLLAAVDTSSAPPDFRQLPVLKARDTGVVEVLGRWHMVRAALIKQLKVLLLAALSIGGLLAFWHFATLNQWQFYVRFTNVPTPESVFTNLVQMAGNARFQTNIGMSVSRIMTGFSFACCLGISMGLVCGRFATLRGVIFPALEVLRPIPAIAWVPISIMLWPTTETSIVFITFIGAFFPIFMNTMAGVRGVDPVLLRASQALGATEWVVLTKVILPAALPHIFTGLAVGMGVAWVSLIAAEMISGQFGVGYFTWEAYSLIEYPNIVLGMVVIGVLGLLCSGAIVWLSRLLMPWLAVTGKGGEK